MRISNRKAFAHVVGNLSERANIFMLFLLKGVYRNFILFSFTNVSCQICNFLIAILMFIMMCVVFCQNCHLGPCFYMADNRSTGLCILWPNTQLLASCSLRACSSCWWNLQQFCEQCGLTLTVECCFSPVYEGSSVTLFIEESLCCMLEILDSLFFYFSLFVTINIIVKRTEISVSHLYNSYHRRVDRALFK